MSEEESSHALERTRAIRGGHCGVVTKLVREAEEIITAATGPLSAWGRNQLSVIKQQLEVKLTIWKKWTRTFYPLVTLLE